MDSRPLLVVVQMCGKCRCRIRRILQQFAKV